MDEVIQETTLEVLLLKDLLRIDAIDEDTYNRVFKRLTEESQKERAM